MLRFKKGDFVRISDAEGKNLNYDSRPFRGKEGVITRVDKDLKYPYEIAFFDKCIQEENNSWGWLCWKDDELDLAY